MANDTPRNDEAFELEELQAQANAAMSAEPMFDPATIAEQEAQAQAYEEQMGSEVSVEDFEDDTFGVLDENLDDEDEQPLVSVISPQQKQESQKENSKIASPPAVSEYGPKGVARTATPGSVSSHVRKTGLSPAVAPRAQGVTERRPDRVDGGAIKRSRDTELEALRRDGVLDKDQTLSFDIEAGFGDISREDIVTRDYTKEGFLGETMRRHEAERDARLATRLGEVEDTSTAVEDPKSGVAENRGDIEDQTLNAQPNLDSPAATPVAEADETEELDGDDEELSSHSDGDSECESAPHTGETEVDKLDKNNTAESIEYIPENIIDQEITRINRGDKHDGDCDEDITEMDLKEFVDGWGELSRTQRRRVMREINVVPIDELDSSLDDADQDFQELKKQLATCRQELKEALVARDAAVEDKQRYQSQVEQLRKDAAVSLNNKDESEEDSDPERAAAEEEVKPPSSTDDTPYEPVVE